MFEKAMTCLARRRPGRAPRRAFRLASGSALAGLFLLSGCATLTGEGRKQILFIDSDPPGAAVYSKNEKLGVTPSLVLVPRSRHGELSLRQGGDEKKVPLRSTYRWSGSFAKNFLILSYAPIGWLVDLWTGAAWEMSEPEKVKLSPSLAGKERAPKQKIVIIAPPVARTLGLSTRGGEIWESELSRRDPSLKVVPFNESVKAFVDQGFDFDGTNEDPEAKKRLLYRLKADEIFVSDVSETALGLRLEGRLEDSRGERRKAVSFDLAERGESQLSPLDRFQYYFGLRDLVPNTLGFDFSNPRVVLEETSPTGSINHESKNLPQSSFLGQFSEKIESLSISRVQAPRLDHGGRFRAKFVPGGKISYQQFYFPTFSSFADAEFEHIRLAAGIGAEGGYSYGRNYLYLKYIPLLSYYKIFWKNPEGEVKHQETFSVDGLMELGYIFFFNQKLHLKFYTRTTTTDARTWKKVVQDIDPRILNLEAPRETVYGLGLGYILF